MTKDISLFTRYIYFHPLNPLCERGREAGGKTEGASPKIDGLGIKSSASGFADAVVEGREMRHSADTLHPNLGMDVL